jgi:heat shock protein HslJ
MTGTRSPRTLPAVLGLLGVLGLLAAGCGDTGAGAGDATAAPEGEWVLVEGSGPDGPIALVEGHVPTLTIDDGSWGGTVCNHYFAEAEVDGDRVSISGVGGTEMACLADGAMESEAAYYAALGGVERHHRVGDRLVLSGSDVELVFDPVEPEPDADLEGTVWRLDAIVEGGGPDGSVSSVLGAPTLELTDGRLSGDGGCNTFSVGYELDGDRLRVGDDLMTSTASCEDAVDAQERHLLAVLDAGPTWTIEGPVLTLTADDGAGLVLRAD